MFSSPLHLTVHRPSPTTASFTISNAPIRSVVSARIIFAVSILLRAVVGFFVASVVFAKVKLCTITDVDLLESNIFFHSYVGRLVCLVACRLDWRFLFPLTLATIWTIFNRGYEEESLLVMRDLGVQTSTSSSTYLSTSHTKFIPTNLIQDIVIHEAFKGFEVRFYLALIGDGERETVVVFPNLLPKRKLLEEVWRGAKDCLYEPK
ncbi:MAG: hypothetical protein M1834_000965 [Cirrosporium novae-zelandiae]|nr:MAG: hypothetical protein M1834_000965 [Cirrosporium novae-zelandiae]